ncbi:MULTISPECIES: hypothetical protein [Nonomuraea]|uniref:Uncharacterized protein n=1 Tax=Nonomuraea mangrovi TaxID=2316207 RepID=A0ABW4TG00_9ACTN
MTFGHLDRWGTAGASIRGTGPRSVGAWRDMDATTAIPAAGAGQGGSGGGVIADR